MRAALLVAALLSPDYTVATVQRPTPVSAYAGHVVWSQFEDGAFRLYEAHASPAGQVTTRLAAPPRGVPFDADIGPGRDGKPTVVYSRCRTEPRLGADQLPIWATGRGCRIYELGLGATAETRLPGAGSEFLPSIWRDRIAFGRVYDRYPYVYVRAGGGTSKRQPGGLRGATGLPGPTSLDLAGIRLALTWGATVNGDYRTDARLDTTTGGHELLEFTTGQGRGERVVNAFVFAGRVWWAHETDTGPLHRYRRWRIAKRRLEEADIPADRQPTLGIAPQSASSVYWSQPGRIGGDGFVHFQASL
jgi:hypothetical protein